MQTNVLQEPIVDDPMLDMVYNPASKGVNILKSNIYKNHVDQVFNAFPPDDELILKSDNNKDDIDTEID